ncbi:reverse transcriptase domain-containing protein [Tanacetum coccineum]
MKVCPNKVDVVLSLASLKCLKDVQKLNGKLASLNRFLAKSTEKSLPFFKTFKKCTKKSDFHWTTEAKEAFKQMKRLIAELPMLTAPMKKEELIVYLAAAKETVSVVLMTEREAKQMPIYGKPRISVKWQILEDFIVERPEEESPNTLMEVEEEPFEPWILVKENDLSKIVTSHLTTKKIIEKCTKALAIGLLKIESKPINAYFKNNRDVHHDYLKVTKEDVATLHELLEEARALKSLDEHIGRVSSTHASGSKPKSNTKNDRIQRTLSRSKKNKVEAHFRKFKSSDYKNNHVSDYNVNVKNIALSKNYDTICLSCNECLFPANHDACVV